MSRLAAVQTCARQDLVGAWESIVAARKVLGADAASADVHERVDHLQRTLRGSLRACDAGV